MKAIKTGQVSAEKSDNVEWRIEPVELFRVWPPVNGVQQPLQPNITGSDTPGLQAANSLCGEQVAEDRKSGVQGQSVYVRVELGGRGIVTQTTTVEPTVKVQ